MSIKLQANSGFAGQIQETNSTNRNYYLPDNDSGLGTRLMTAQATTSGTYVDFLNIPSWVKRITVMLNGVSTNGTSNLLVRLGTSGGFVTSGYEAVVYEFANATATAGTSSTAGFPLSVDKSATDASKGVLTIVNLTGNTWNASGTGSDISNSWGTLYAGAISLSGTLTQVRLTTVNGTDTFDAGNVNVMYE